MARTKQRARKRAAASQGNRKKPQPPKPASMHEIEQGLAKVRLERPTPTTRVENHDRVTKPRPKKTSRKNRLRNRFQALAEQDESHKNDKTAPSSTKTTITTTVNDTTNPHPPDETSPTCFDDFSALALELRKIRTQQRHGSTRWRDMIRAIQDDKAQAQQRAKEVQNEKRKR